MDLIITINLDNEAMREHPAYDLENIFEQVYQFLETVEVNNLSKTLRDSNGNTVGTVKVTE